MKVGRLGTQVLLASIRHEARTQNAKLLELSRFVEDALIHEQKRVASNMESEIARVVDPGEKEFLLECYGDDVFDVEEVYPRIQRYALFVTAVSQVEGAVVALCKGARFALELEKEFNAKGNEVINRAVSYLEKKAEIDTSRIQYYTGLADDLRIVRNCIVHSQGRLNERKKEDIERIRSFAKEIPAIELGNYDMLVLKAGFVDHSAHEMGTFVERLYDLLYKKVESPG